MAKEEVNRPAALTRQCRIHLKFWKSLQQISTDSSAFHPMLLTACEMIDIKQHR